MTGFELWLSALATLLWRQFPQVSCEVLTFSTGNQLASGGPGQGPQKAENFVVSQGPEQTTIQGTVFESGSTSDLEGEVDLIRRRFNGSQQALPSYSLLPPPVAAEPAPVLVSRHRHTKPPRRSGVESQSPQNSWVLHNQPQPLPESLQSQLMGQPPPPVVKRSHSHRRPPPALQNLLPLAPVHRHKHPPTFSAHPPPSQPPPKSSLSPSRTKHGHPLQIATHALAQPANEAHQLLQPNAFLEQAPVHAFPPTILAFSPPMPPGERSGLWHGDESVANPPHLSGASLASAVPARRRTAAVPHSEPTFTVTSLDALAARTPKEPPPEATSDAPALSTPEAPDIPLALAEAPSLPPPSTGRLPRSSARRLGPLPDFNNLESAVTSRSEAAPLKAPPHHFRPGDSDTVG